MSSKRGLRLLKFFVKMETNIASYFVDGNDLGKKGEIECNLGEMHISLEYAIGDGDPGSKQRHFSRNN